MRSVRAWWLRLAASVCAGDRDQELADELESHLALHIDDNIRAGMDPAAARRHALMALGGVDQTKERYRDRRGFVANEQLLFDVRLAVRALGRRPLLLAAAVASIAVGAGANVAVYTVLQRVLFSTSWLVASDPQRLVTVNPGLSYLNFRDLQRAEPNVDFAAFTMAR